MGYLTGYSLGPSCDSARFLVCPKPGGIYTVQVLAQERGVKLIFSNEPLDDSADGRMMEGSLRGWTSSIRQTWLKMWSGKGEKLPLGFWVSAEPPYGYCRDGPVAVPGGRAR